MRRLLALLVLALLPGSVWSAPFALEDARKIVFLGDSNTFAGRYIAYLDGYLFTRFPDRSYSLLNLGLPSETVSGLSEPDHPYPRPHVHTRIEKALDATKPEVVFACYGMNDGIYYPPSKERLAKFQQGMTGLVKEAEQRKSKVLLITSPPFDAVPVLAKTLDVGAPKYSWMQPFKGYDEVLTGYAKWMRETHTRIPVLDAHTAVNEHLDLMRKENPKYLLARDGIHPNAIGHWVIARTALDGIGAPKLLAEARLDLKSGKVQRGKIASVSKSKEGVTFSWTIPRPMPTDPALSSPMQREQMMFNRLVLVGINAEKERYTLYEGEKRIGVLTAEALRKGVDLSEFQDLSIFAADGEFWKLVVERQRLLGRAWLTHVGHNRPGTPKGKPLQEALRESVPLEAKIRKLAKPITLELRLVAE